MKTKLVGCRNTAAPVGIFLVSGSPQWCIVTLLGRGGLEGGAEGERNYYCGNIISYILVSFIPIITISIQHILI